MELRKNWGKSSVTVVRISRIETEILAIEGIIDIGKTKLNGIEENLMLGTFEIPVLGGIEVE